MLPLVRLATIHAALAHFTIGGLPLIVIAYAIALRRRASEWVLVGDAALAVTALATLATCTFGLVSNVVVPWPGGIELWRWLHLAGGVAATVLLAGIAAIRIVSWRDRVASSRVLVAVLLAGGVAGATGWIGGEVLVFHSGMAVRAAGDGALAGRVHDSDAEPADFLAAMRELRGTWGDVTTRLAWMLVQHPRDEDFARIEHEAHRMEHLANFMSSHGTGKDADTIASMSQVLAGDATEIADAAHAHSLQDIAHAVGEANAHCADCHSQTRWH